MTRQRLHTCRLLIIAPLSVVILYSLRVILNEQAGMPVFTNISICDASSQISVINSELEIMEDLQISHQIGALFSTSFDQKSVLIAVERLERSTQKANK